MNIIECVSITHPGPCDILFVFRSHRDQRHLRMRKAILTLTFRGEKIEKVAFLLVVMNKENDDPDFKSPKKKKQIKLSKRVEKVSTQKVIDEIYKGYVSANTKRNTEWSRRVFAEWRASRDDEEVCPPDILENPNIKKLNFWIPRFINEVRCIDGQPYPPRTINQILAGLQRHLLDNDWDDIHIP